MNTYTDTLTLTVLGIQNFIIDQNGLLFKVGEVLGYYEHK